MLNNHIYSKSNQPIAHCMKAIPPDTSSSKCRFMKLSQGTCLELEP